MIVMEKHINKTVRKIIIFLALILCSCNFSVNSVQTNKESDKEQAEAVAAKLYWHTLNNEFDKIPELFGATFYKENKKEDLVDFLLKKKEVQGNFIEFNLKDWSTKLVSGTNPLSEYILVYEVKYEKKTVIEKISMIQEKNRIKIVGYYVDL